MYQVKGMIYGTADLLFNEMTEAEKRAIEENIPLPKMTREQRIEEAWQKYPQDEQGAYIRPWMFKVVLVAGANKGKIKDGRYSVGPALMATVFVDGVVRLTPSKADYIHQAMGKRPPKTGGAAMIYRPTFKQGWTANFKINVIDDIRNPEAIRMSLEQAGLLVGFGAWRPEHGRFSVPEWEVIKKGEK